MATLPPYRPRWAAWPNPILLSDGTYHQPLPLIVHFIPVADEPASSRCWSCSCAAPATPRAPRSPFSTPPDTPPSLSRNSSRRRVKPEPFRIFPSHCTSPVASFPTPRAIIKAPAAHLCDYLTAGCGPAILPSLLCPEDASPCQCDKKEKGGQVDDDKGDIAISIRTNTNNSSGPGGDLVAMDFACLRPEVFDKWLHLLSTDRLGHLRLPSESPPLTMQNILQLCHLVRCFAIKAVKTVRLTSPVGLGPPSAAVGVRRAHRDSDTTPRQAVHTAPFSQIPFSPSGPYGPSEAPPSSLAGHRRPCPLATYHISRELRREKRDRDEESEDEDWPGDPDVEACGPTMFPMPPFGVLRTANVGVGGLGGLPTGSLSLLVRQEEDREQRDAIGRRSAAAAAASSPTPCSSLLPTGRFPSPSPPCGDSSDTDRDGQGGVVFLPGGMALVRDSETYGTILHKGIPLRLRLGNKQQQQQQQQQKSRAREKGEVGVV
ncbi:unnamed protein product [Vitrella brassicaformis CCMP3155]|uniref:Uncharacterized protein n=1 Tax=Vitrella brassicaformis (strain CCMP3155) TaxID=1169540 RepID=A0A0G4EHF3_VITBC|nr:unnamed protein product [Vitrella brassicaformis CCMP3155]|eukprot:CEL95455.1 unnamed protein product [Vitrella brassicaformis CCMP3155]